METYEIISMVILFVGIISIHYLKRFIVFQFISILFLAFAIGFLINEPIESMHFTRNTILLFGLLFVGLIYQTITFYLANLRTGNK